MEKPGVGRTTPGYFQFCFYLHLRNWKPMRHTTAVKNESDKELNWTGQRTTRFADGHIFTSSEPDSTKHSPMQNSSLHRTQEAGTGSRGRFPGHPSWHSSLICNSSLTGLFMLRSPSQHPLKHKSTAVLCGPWFKVAHSIGGAQLGCQSSALLPGHASSLLASFSQSSPRKTHFRLQLVRLLSTDSKLKDRLSDSGPFHRRTLIRKLMQSGSCLHREF